MLKKSPIIQVAIYSLVLYVVQTLMVMLFGFKVDYQNFNLDNNILFLSMVIVSVLIVVIINAVKNIAFEYIGYTFLAIITLKMVGFYVVFVKMIEYGGQVTFVEKCNLVILFLAFLIVDAVVSAKILNFKSLK